MKKIAAVYRITINPGVDFYIGSSSNVVKRRSSHLYNLKTRKHVNKLLQDAYNKHGFFHFEILKECNESELLKFEQMYIDELKPTLNICQVAGSSLGYKHNEESLKKITEFNRNLSKNEDWLKKVKSTWFKKGFKHKPFTKEQIEKRVKSFMGYKHSEETKLKMKEKAKSRSYENYDLVSFQKIGSDASKIGVRQYTLNGILVNEFSSIRDALKQFKTKQTRHLREAMKIDGKKYKGYLWKEVNPVKSP